jgi:hypothetical protein
MEMPDKTAAAKQSHELAGDRLIEMAQKKAPSPEPKLLPKDLPPDATLAPAKKSRTSLAQKFGRLKPLLPILSGGLRLVDHGAVQALAQLINLVDGGGIGQPAVDEELHQGLAEIQTGHRELSLQVQDQTVAVKRAEDQITLLRKTIERNATEHAELVEEVKSFKKLVRAIGAGLAVLLIALIVLAGILLTRHF